MASDRARLSHDPSRQYRSLVLQQGRVSLEADTNEASRLAETALRQDIIDIVGPMGTPDDGYEVKVGSGGGLGIGAGSYYVGGWRVALDEPIRLGEGPDEADLDPTPLGDGQYAVALLLTEQEVSAVEDHALLEVALGGPDTCQRTRLMQRAVAVPIGGDDCKAAFADLTEALGAEGADYDPATGAIVPRARLHVTLVSSPAPADPCDPPASGGYLGADNQLIRVAVTAFDPTSGKGKFVWGYDNASTLYRASTADGKILTLEGEPVDNDHAPRVGQAVEVLRTRSLFDHNDVVAADSGVVTEVAEPYDPDLRRVVIAATLPAAQWGDSAHPLFLRLWKAEMEFGEGSAVELGDTGLAITLTLNSAPGSIVARPFWNFAARPSTPVIVYPRRYLDSAQPPEGPRQWLAPLAVAAVAKEGARILDDCRDTFLPLTRSGCCGIMLDSEARGRRDQIQRALDRLRGTRGTVTLRPGHYKLRRPIRLDSSHRGLTLEGCGEGVFLEAESEQGAVFAEGLIVLDEADEITLRSLQFQMPVATLTQDGLAALSISGAKIQAGKGSIGVSATGCAQLTVTECQFRFRLKERRALFAVGLLARGECWGLRMTHNRFLHDIDYVQTAETLRLLYGYALVPAIAVSNKRLSLEALSEARIDALLEAAEITDNQFVGLTIAIMISARLGYVRIERNRVQGCSGGIYLLESAMGVAPRIVREYDTDERTGVRELASTMGFAAALPATQRSPIVINTAEVEESESGAELRFDSFYNEFMTGDGGVRLILDTGRSKKAGARLSSALGLIGAVIDSHFRRLVPALHVSGNDIDVFGTLPHERADSGGRRGSRGKATRSDDLPRLVALQVILGLRSNSAGDVLVTSNRLANRRNPAAMIEWTERLVVASNMVIGSGGDESGGALAILVDSKSGRLEVMANVVQSYPQIIPSQRPMEPSQDWSFVNRIS